MHCPNVAKKANKLYSTAAKIRYSNEPYFGSSNIALRRPDTKNANKDEYPNKNINKGQTLSTYGKYRASETATTKSSDIP